MKKTMRQYLSLLADDGICISFAVRDELIRITEDVCTYEAKLFNRRQVKIINQIMEDFREWSKQ